MVVGMHEALGWAVYWWCGELDRVQLLLLSRAGWKGVSWFLFLCFILGPDEKEWKTSPLLRNSTSPS